MPINVKSMLKLSCETIPEYELDEIQYKGDEYSGDRRV